jgi:hypothetical protein
MIDRRAWQEFLEEIEESASAVSSEGPTEAIQMQRGLSCQRYFVF